MMSGAWIVSLKILKEVSSEEVEEFEGLGSKESFEK